MAEEAALHEKGGEGLLSTPVGDPGSDGLLPVPPQFSVSTVIVTNISPLATEQDLRDFFANCGNIVQINLLGYSRLASSFHSSRDFSPAGPDLSLSLAAQSQGRPRHLSIRLRAIRDHGAGQRCPDSVYRCSCRHASPDRHGCERHTRWRGGGSDGGTPYSPGAHTSWTRGNFGARAPGCHSALACAAIGFPGQRAELSRKAGRDRTHDLRGQRQLDGTSILTLSLFLVSSSFFVFFSSSSPMLLTHLSTISPCFPSPSSSSSSLYIPSKGAKLATPSSSFLARGVNHFKPTPEPGIRQHDTSINWLTFIASTETFPLSLSSSPLMLCKMCRMAYNVHPRSR